MRLGIRLACWAIAAVGNARAIAPPSAIVADDAARMVLIPAGPFVMGSGEGLPDEAPPHRVDLPAYYIDETEVSCARYALFLKATGAPRPTDWPTADCPKGRENLPITNITWFDAMRYAAWTGKRLPTEAEWEKAARGTDGRRFPWGNADDKEKRNLEIRKDRQQLEPVDSRPAGASPFGTLNMSGNAWEWTADWYAAYPSSTHQSVQFGNKYKVVRGGGAEYYYGLKNLGTTTQRIRTLPYGAHDFIGFRCVRDLNPKTPAYDAKKLIAQAEFYRDAALRKPLRLSYEDQLDSFLKAGQFPLKIHGEVRQAGVARIGIPFPPAVLKDPDSVRIHGSGNAVRITQSKVLARWPDKSIRWLLIDFPASAGEECALNFRSANAPKAPGGISIEMGDEQFDVNTGPIVARVCRDMPLEQVKLKNGPPIIDYMLVTAHLASGGQTIPYTFSHPVRWDLWDKPTARYTTRFEGPLGEDVGSPSAFRADIQLTFSKDSPRIEVTLTITHKAPRKASVNVSGIDVDLVLQDAPKQIVFGTDRGEQTIDGGKPISLYQPDDLSLQITRDGATIGTGTRAPGWMAAQLPAGWVTVATEHFWQNSPKAIIADGKRIGVRLLATTRPFAWEGGLAKTHKIILDFSRDKPGACAIAPLRVSMPPAWACGSGALGAPILPRGRESLERFPYWEVAREASMRDFVRGMPAGFRHFGDAYLGGPYKGKNAYQNLEYDIHFNFLMEYLRTGQTWYLEAADAMARHQADIDTDHWTGQPWKHSPQHTTTEAELGHVFLRGLVLHYLLTGEQRSLDAAREAGDWIAATLEKGQGTGNERQIGWSLYALTGLYDVTRDPKYLHACETLCNRLLAGQSPTGQFKTIRWDNRISFFNGIAMNGMITVYEHNRDEKLAEGILRVADRTLGMYPEYACRTLDAYIWCARRTNDPRFLDAIARTWELSTEYLKEPISEETHAWRFRDFAARHDLFRLFDAPPQTRIDPSSWRAIRFRKNEAEVYLKPISDRAATVMIVREGQADGRAELFDASGRRIATYDLLTSPRIYDAVSIPLPTTGSPFRLRLTSAAARGWQVHHDASSRLTVYDPAGAQLPDIYPRAFGFVEDGAQQIQIKLEAMGEGFHAATLYDADNRPVKTIRHFIDFEDPGRYELNLGLDLKDEIGPLQAWSLEIHNCKVVSVKGMLPYWATSPQQLFHPEREK